MRRFGRRQGTGAVIASYLHKRLKELFETERSAKIDRRRHARIILLLDALDRATRPEDLHLPGLDFHMLRGFKPPRYTVHVNGPWCITFEFEQGDARRVDLEQYH